MSWFNSLLGKTPDPGSIPIPKPDIIEPGSIWFNDDEYLLKNSILERKNLGLEDYELVTNIKEAMDRDNVRGSDIVWPEYKLYIKRYSKSKQMDVKQKKYDGFGIITEENGKYVLRTMNETPHKESGIELSSLKKGGRTRKQKSRKTRLYKKRKGRRTRNKN